MILRELRILRLQKGTLYGALSFYTLALFCIALAIGPEPTVLGRSAPALIWILCVLTTLFSTPQLLKQEENEGILDEMMMRPSHPALFLLSKMAALFFFMGVPLILVGASLSPLFALPLDEVLTLIATLLIGFPALSSLTILGGLLTLNSRGDGILISLLILPLILPLILFSLSAAHMVRLGLDSSPSFCLLTSVSLILVIVSMTAGTKALRFAVEG